MRFIKVISAVGLPVFFEACFFGAMTLVVMTFNNPNMLSAHIFLMTIFEIFNCIFLGINISLNSLAANALGNKNELKCKRLIKFAYLSTFALAIVVLLPLYFLKD